MERSLIARVFSIISHGRWAWPGNHERYSHRFDSPYEWGWSSGVASIKFSGANQHGRLLEWWSQLSLGPDNWLGTLSAHIPRWSFILWLVCHGTVVYQPKIGWLHEGVLLRTLVCYVLVLNPIVTCFLSAISPVRFGDISWSSVVIILTSVSGPIQQNNKSVEAVILGIVVDIRACLMGWTQVPNSVENKSLCRVWGMPQRWWCS